MKTSRMLNKWLNRFDLSKEYECEQNCDTKNSYVSRKFLIRRVRMVKHYVYTNYYAVDETAGSYASLRALDLRSR